LRLSEGAAGALKALHTSDEWTFFDKTTLLLVASLRRQWIS
jgi:hypothetical protein